MEEKGPHFPGEAPHVTLQWYSWVLVCTQVNGVGVQMQSPLPGSCPMSHFTRCMASQESPAVSFCLGHFSSSHGPQADWPVGDMLLLFICKIEQQNHWPKVSERVAESAFCQEEGARAVLWHIPRLGTL